MKQLKTFAILILIATTAMIYGCKSSTAPVTPTRTYHIVSPSDSLPLGYTWDYWLSAFVNWRYSVIPFGTTPPPTIVNGLRFAGGITSKLGDTSTRRDTTIHYSIPYGTKVGVFFNVLWRTTSGDTSLAQVAYDDSIISIGLRIPKKTTAGISCSVDGDPVLNIEGYYEYTKKPFDVFVADSNHWGIRVDPAHPGHYHGTAGGYYIMIDQLSVGDHTIHFHYVNGTTFVDSRSIVTVQ